MYDHTPADPPLHTCLPVVEAAVEPEIALEHMDASLHSRSPSLASTKPGLTLVGDTLRRPLAGLRQNDLSNALLPCIGFVGRRVGTSICAQYSGRMRKQL